jgi:hypothetical protein
VERLAKLSDTMPDVLRITEWKDQPIPVPIVKERYYGDEDEGSGEGERHRARSVLID